MIADLGFANVLDRIWSDCRSWQFAHPAASIVQNNSRIERDDLFGRNKQRIDVDLFDPTLLDDQLTEPHQNFLERVKIDSVASTKSFQVRCKFASVPLIAAPVCD